MRFLNRPATSALRRTFVVNLNVSTIVLLGVLVLLIIAAAGGGGFVLGQDSRKSPQQVARELRAAVDDAVASQFAADKRLLDRTVTRRLAAQRALQAKRMTRIKRRMQRAAVRRANVAYDQGSSAGYVEGNSAGYSEGTQDGLEQGSDDLSCSDDPDVYWLPACDF